MEAATLFTLENLVQELIADDEEHHRAIEFASKYTFLILNLVQVTSLIRHGDHGKKQI
jgi:hypothetical protein